MLVAVRLSALSLVLQLGVTCAAAEEPFSMAPATPPEQAAATIQLQDRFRAELIAAEPLVTDPVDIAYDEYGRAYVCEMNDYPYVDPQDDRPWEEQSSEPIGRVRLLEDSDGDGRFDRSTIFADKLSWPAGIACSRGGVYVAATPDLLYLKDTDGDGRADIRRVVFEGFRKYNVQAVMNNLKWGLDHHIYVAGSSNGGAVTSPDADDEPVRFGRSDFRFDPDEERFELVAGGARFGNSFDDWGNRFVCNIRNPVQHVLFPERYQRRNRYLSLSSLMNDVAPSGDAIAVYRVSPPEPWRVINAERLANAPTKNLYDSTQATGYVTSSSGVTIYRGGAYPEEFLGNAFVGEVAGNLVIRYQLEPSGPSFRGVRPYDQRDFLASTDNWFRPVNFANAPDGTLHVLDMYRQTIEHPWSLPDDLQQRLSLTEGRDRGRIYRLLPPQYRDGFVPPPKPQLGDATTKELVRELENPNSWWRETAHRLIHERQDAAAVPLLKAMLRDSEIAVARLHALWSLEGLSELEIDDLQVALSDEDPRLQKHAVRLAESRLDDASIRSAVRELADSSDAAVRFQVALTLGELADNSAAALLSQMLRRDGDDPWMRAAILSSLGGQETALLLDILTEPEFATSSDGRSVVMDIAVTVGARSDADNIVNVFNRLTAAEFDSAAGNAFRHDVTVKLGQGLRRQGKTLSGVAASADTAGTNLLSHMLQDAEATLSSSSASTDSRLAAIERLSFADFDVAFPALSEAVHPREPIAIQSAAITALAAFGRPEVQELLIDVCPSLTPAMQDVAVSQLLTRSNWIVPLFDAMLEGKIPPGRVATVRQEIYLKSANDEIRRRAEKLFATSTPGERAAIVERYRAEMPSSADAARGRLIFEKHCANCHKSGSLGYEVGPHLSTVKSRSADELIINILDPNREISPNYLTYVVATLDGRVHNGVVAAESAATITLRQAERKEVTIDRDQIEEFRNLGKSLMPEGIEKEITPERLADLIAFIKGQ